MIFESVFFLQRGYSVWSHPQSQTARNNAVIGDFHGLNTLKYQPAKVAAVEGHWENHGDEVRR